MLYPFQFLFQGTYNFKNVTVPGKYFPIKSGKGMGILRVTGKLSEKGKKVWGATFTAVGEFS